MLTSPSPSTPFTLVGRERELSVLREHVGAALLGHGSLVLIGGEAGIGKTTLAEIISREAAEQGALVLVGRCYDLTETPPYGPWVELFGQYRPTDDGPRLPDAFAEHGTVGAVTSQAALFRQMREFLATLSARRPLVVLLDDLHWADVGSLDLVRFLARNFASHPLLLLVTYRSDELTRRHPLSHLLPLLVHESSATRLTLHPLAPAETAALVRARFVLPDADATRLTGYLHQRAEGNPFFIGELLRMLEEARALRLADDGWTLGDLIQVPIPPLLRYVIDGRLARLNEDAHRLLAVAAVIGQDVSLSLWMTVANVSEEALLLAVERAMDAHLFAQTLENERLHFTHALIREALYVGISPVQRRIWHRQVGEALVLGANPDPDAVAHHFQQAGDARAVPWLIQAGERAERAYAWLTAADRFEAAVMLMDTYGADAGARGWLLVRVARLRRYTNPRQGIACLDIAAQLAKKASDDLLGALAIFHRGLLFCFVGEIHRGLAEMRAGVRARKKVSVADRARAAEMPSVFALHGACEDNGEEALVHWLAGAGRFAEARTLGERTLGGTPTQLPREMIVGAHQTDIFRGLGYAYTMLALPEEAARAFAMVATGLRNEENYANLGLNAIDTLRFLVLYHADQHDARERLVRDAAAAWQLATDASHDDFQRYIRLPLLAVEGRWAELRRLPMATFDSLAWTLRDTRGPVLRHQGESDLAWEQIDEVLPNGPTTAPGNVRFYVAIGCQRLAAALALDNGDLPTARAWLEAHDRWLAWSGAVLGQAEGHLGWAAYHRAAGEPTLSYEHATTALTHAMEPRQPLAQLAAHRLLGELDTSAGCLTDAAHHFDAALSLADACAAPYERALTLLARAHLSAAVGDEAEALTLLDEVREICTILGAAPALARADALAARLAVGIPPPSPSSGSLTNREVEVLRLLAGGSSIRQIAAELFLSARTVERHITTIYRKIDARGRVDATAYALRNGLATAPRHDS